MTPDKAASYQTLYDDFGWDIPDQLNMARQVCDVRAEREPDRVAIIEWDDGEIRRTGYRQLQRMADSLAFALSSRGIGSGDRVGVLRSQSPWTAAAHIAIWKLGAISIPLFRLFGPDALTSRLSDAEAKLVITDDEPPGALSAWTGETLVPEGLTVADTPFKTASTGPEDPAVLIYTSGTTGSPKGALHGHRVLTGHLPGVEMSHDFLGQDGDCLWTPADWAWIGGLFDVLMPGLALGIPVVAARQTKFSPNDCAKIIRDCGIRNIFFPPTALRMLKAADTRLPGLRSVASGGEPLGAEMLDWGRKAFGLAINEFYGQTECNMIASSCSSLFDAQPGAIGKPVPGHTLRVINETGEELGDGEEGEIAVKRGSASMMLEYWKKPEATSGKFRGDFMLTGDRGMWRDGFLHFVGREDDVITSAGYRIGPAEIEDCLMRHPAVATVGVIGKPDPLRTEIVKAYVVLKDGFKGTEELEAELSGFVKSRLSKHLYPREVTFLDALPMTVTGKVIRKALKTRAIEESRQSA